MGDDFNPNYFLYSFNYICVKSALIYSSLKNILDAIWNKRASNIGFGIKSPDTAWVQCKLMFKFCLFTKGTRSVIVSDTVNIFKGECHFVKE